ncbi:LLM class F420-dependent oxidoreductase [Rhodococcus antarcticus]|uniref:LLM class F420-dependent oxidoreductase n=1 Tax=Rhodococcus antarcticus TaxID=2987751 RepID=A0ABY6NZK8_9NOCA|nr:LLM class F420-dependent oxidoreductase [Rhodococcus antarcticus]UZJ24849.1 LLM class F420-dependent oxidoreductase [Rhodococcus antarcticus]
MRLGLQVPSFTWPGGAAALGATFATVARSAEDTGFASFWVMDHFFQIEMVGPAEDPMLEGYSALAFAAAVTDTIELGTMVTGVTYRHPGVLVKTVTTLDVLSGGRAYLGIGAAWNEQEHRGLGVPYPPLAERFERLEETLQVARQMWAGDESAFDGAHHQLERPLSSPQPVRTPHPPILIGGTGEKKTLRFVAKYGDACNIFEMGTEAVAHKLDVLQQHCATEGREYAEIEKTTLGTLSLSADGREGTMTVAQAVDRFGAYAAIGVDQAIVSLAAVHDPVAFELVPELVAQLATITPAGR